MPKSDLSGNMRAVQSFRQAIEFCTLPHVPQTTRQILSTGAWRDRFEMGKRIRFDDFYKFITVSPSKGGCGLEPEKVTALLRKADDHDALDMWLKAIRMKQTQEIDEKDQANLRPAHRPKTVDNKNTDINTSRPTGTSVAYAIRKLRADRPDIHARVLAGELTANAGMVEAGFRKKRPRKKPELVCPMCGHKFIKERRK